MITLKEKRNRFQIGFTKVLPLKWEGGEMTKGLGNGWDGVDEKQRRTTWSGDESDELLSVGSHGTAIWKKDHGIQVHGKVKKERLRSNTTGRLIGGN